MNLKFINLEVRITLSETWQMKGNSVIKSSFLFLKVPINLKDSYMGYGAVVPDGYGVSYNLQDNHVIFAISSFFSCQDTNSRRFTQAVDVSLKEMKLLFTTEKDEE